MGLGRYPRFGAWRSGGMRSQDGQHGYGMGGMGGGQGQGMGEGWVHPTNGSYGMVFYFTTV